MVWAYCLQASRSSSMGNVLLSGTSSSRREFWVAWSDMANETPSSEAIFGIRGTTPEVEMVILDFGQLRPDVSVNIFIALLTFLSIMDTSTIVNALLSYLQLYSGSPWPMNTMLEMTRLFWRGKSFDRWAAIMYWPMISAAVRFLRSFCVPVWQKLQLKEHPIWDDTQSVALFCSGIKIVSTTAPGS